MSETEQAILNALNELDTAVKSMPTAGSMPNLLPIFQRLDMLASQLPKRVNPDLLHYLNRKSYEKARLLLEGHNPENAHGTCH